MDNVEIKNLSEAKKEYTQQLVNILKNEIYKGINTLYISVKDNQNYLEEFQSKLREIPKWNQDIIDKNYQDFITNSGCDWLDELLQAVFISNTAILTTVKSKNTVENKIDLTIPKCSRFLHKCYIDSAREFFKNPYLFMNDLDYKTTQKNMRDALELISISIENSIRNLLPMRDILRQYLKGVEINAEKGTDFHLSDETITQKQETSKDEKIIEQLENVVEQINNNEIIEKVPISNEAQIFQEEPKDLLKVENMDTLNEKNKLLNENIERLNDINSESEDDNNEEELIDYMKSLNKNIGTETEMKIYENETLVDNNLESTEKKQINIAELSDKNFEQHNLVLENNESDNDEIKIEDNFEDPNLIKNQNLLEEDVEDDLFNNDNNGLDMAATTFFNQPNEEQQIHKLTVPENFNLPIEESPVPENLNLIMNNNMNFKPNEINTSTILPPKFGGESLDENETSIGKYELNLENLELNDTLKEASNLIKNFNNDEEITRDMDEMKIDLTNINNIEDELQLINSEKKEWCFS